MSNVRRQNNKQPAPTRIAMPELSRFLGIVIAMYYRDHPPPHFHAIYGEFDITVDIVSGQVNGAFPKRALAHVLECGEWPISGAGFKRPKSRTLAHSRVVSGRDGALSVRCTAHR
jgi:hypothetical protein